MGSAALCGRTIGVIKDGPVEALADRLHELDLEPGGRRAAVEGSSTERTRTFLDRVTVA